MRKSRLSEPSKPARAWNWNLSARFRREDGTLISHGENSNERLGTSYSIVLMCVTATSLMTTPSSAAKRGDTYKAKKAECKREAKSKNFGIHLVERNRWINDCIAGRRS